MIKFAHRGQIKEVHFKEGQEFKEGDVLFTLDDRALRAQLAQSEATSSATGASLQRAKPRGRAAERACDARRRVGAKVRGRGDRAGGVLKPRPRGRSGRRKRPVTWPTRRSRRVTAGPDRSLQEGNLVKATELSTTAPLVTITQLRPI